MRPTVSKCLSLLVASVVFVWVLNCTKSMNAQVLFSEDFEDQMLTENAMVNEHVTIESGVARFNDPPTEDPTPDRATFVVVRDFTDPVLTFSFDIVEPVVSQLPGTRMEMLFRAGIGTGNNTLSSGEQIVEAIMFRGAGAPGSTRGAYLNNGNETIFLVANNNSTPLMFASPIDGSNVMLNGFEYIPYVRNNETGMFGEVKGISVFPPAHQAVFGTFNRFGIGSSTNADVGTFAIDNVLVVTGVSFDQVVGPMCILGDTDCNNTVDFADFEPIRANFRMTIDSRGEGDLVRNGVVDFADFHEWKAAFLGAGGSLAGVDLGFLASVPEPSAALLMLLGAAALVCYQVRSRDH
jgi:hypothetical protein